MDLPRRRASSAQARNETFADAPRTERWTSRHGAKAARKPTGSFTLRFHPPGLSRLDGTHVPLLLARADDNRRGMT